jgi:transcriptional regulator with XRE-family HTH domain
MPRKGERERRVEARLAARVRYEMWRRGLTLEKMARRIGTTKGALSKRLNESRGFDADLVYGIHTGLGIDADVLLDEAVPERFFVRGMPDMSDSPHGSGHGSSRSRPTGSDA